MIKRGKFVSFRELRVILESRTAIRKKSDNFFKIFIEANPKVAKKKNFYPEADILFNLALTDEELRPASIAKLYIGNGDVLSEGNSLFKEKYPSDEQSYIATLGVASKTFFDELSLYLDKKFAESLMSDKLETPDGNIFVTASATEILAAAAGFNVAKGVLSPIDIASPEFPVNPDLVIA